MCVVVMMVVIVCHIVFLYSAKVWQSFCNRIANSSLALRADPIHQKGPLEDVKALRIIQLGDSNTLETKYFMAHDTMEMRMDVVMGAIRVRAAQFIHDTLITSLDHMYKAVLTESGQSPEHIALVDRLDLISQILHSNGPAAVHQCFQDNETVGRRLDSMALQQLFQVIIVHDVKVIAEFYPQVQIQPKSNIVISHVCLLPDGKIFCQN